MRAPLDGGLDLTEFLLEVRTDGLPGRLLSAAVQQLKRELVRELRRQDLAPSRSATSFTCRRMTVLLRGFEGLEEKGKRGREIVAAAVPIALRRVDWPSRLPQIGDSPPWVRPIRAVLAVLDGEPVRIEALGSLSVGTTIGHPVLSPEPFAVSDSTDYNRKLSSRGIEVQVGERRRILCERLDLALEKVGGGHLIVDEELVDELVRGVEIPGAVAGELDPEFLSIPRELIVRCLRRRHGSFAVAEAVDSAELKPRFVTAMDRLDDPTGSVRRGQELVLQRHLEELREHYDEDRRVPLAERQRRRLHARGQQEEAKISQRVSALAAALCEDLGWREEADRAQEAAGLIGADMDTRLVGLLPGLRGVVGGLLAREEGYPESVWQGVYDHRLPERSGEATPRGRVGKAVALSQRLERLVRVLSSPEPPSKKARSDRPDSSDLEEVGIGVVRILLQGSVDLDLDLAAARAVRLAGPPEGSARDLVAAMRAVFDRCTRLVFAREGFEWDEIEAVLGASGSSLLPLVQRRLVVVHEAREEKEFPRVVQVAARLVAVLGESPEGRVDSDLLREPAERELWNRLRSSRDAIARALEQGESRRWLRAMSALTESLERFLSEVLVRDEQEDLRHNRLALLQAVHRVYCRQVRLAELEVTAGSD